MILRTGKKSFLNIQGSHYISMPVLAGVLISALLAALSFDHYLVLPCKLAVPMNPCSCHDDDWSAFIWYTSNPKI